MLDFQIICFSRKRPWKRATSLLNQICENKFFESDHQISSKCLIRRFLTVITNFLGALSKKKKMTFWEIASQDLKIFLFQTLRMPWFWKQREFLNKLCLRQNIRIMTYPQGGICIMTCPLEHICISISVRRHLHPGLNTCIGIIMNKLCICTPAWDICIIWTFHICILIKSVCNKNEKSRLASHFVCIHRKLTSRSVVNSLSIRCWGKMVA